MINPKIEKSNIFLKMLFSSIIDKFISFGISNFRITPQAVLNLNVFDEPIEQIRELIKSRHMKNDQLYHVTDDLHILLIELINVKIEVFQENVNNSKTSILHTVKFFNSIFPKLNFKWDKDRLFYLMIKPQLYFDDINKQKLGLSIDTKIDSSENAYEALKTETEKFLQILEVSYNIVEICTFYRNVIIFCEYFMKYYDMPIFANIYVKWKSNFEYATKDTNIREMCDDIMTGVKVFEIEGLIDNEEKEIFITKLNSILEICRFAKSIPEKKAEYEAYILRIFLQDVEIFQQNVQILTEIEEFVNRYTQTFTNEPVIEFLSLFPETLFLKLKAIQHEIFNQIKPKISSETFRHFSLIDQYDLIMNCENNDDLIEVILETIDLIDLNNSLILK